jgi:membrane protein DedA with SNARE-associated domain
MLEGMPLGLFVPAHLMVVIAGFLARTGTLGFWQVLVVSFGGATIGDILGYYVGRNYGNAIVSKYGRYLFLGKHNFEVTKRLFREHTRKTVFLVRFNPFTRSFVPFFSGASRISLAKFLVYDLLGGICWAVSSVLTGYVFGASYELAVKYYSGASLALILIIILCFYLYGFFKKKKKISLIK